MVDNVMQVFDLLVYGGTFAGLTAAQRAAERGLSVCLLEPTGWLGGITAAGLTRVDVSQNQTQKEIVRGRTREVLQRIAKAQDGEAQIKRFFPRFARSEFEAMAQKYCERVVLNVPLTSPGAVITREQRIEALQVGREVFPARVFIDASYEGDLLAFSGVPYRVGRESVHDFNESCAGFQPAKAAKREGFRTGVHYPVISRPDFGEGEADPSVLPMNFRGMMTPAANRLPWPKPDDYDRRRYLLLLDLIRSTNANSFFNLVRGYPLPEEARNWNGTGIISLDLFNQSWHYPEADAGRRRAIVAELAAWNQGFFWFLANDAEVPENIRAEARSYGLPAEEFEDSPFGPGWPPIPYVREARRMVGRATLTVHDQNAPNNKKAARVARWNYRRDGKGRILFTDGEGRLFLEGVVRDPYKYVDTYDIELGCILPREGSVSNLIVPVCFSSTALAWVSARMEPLFAMLGEAGGELAAFYVNEAVPFDEVNVQSLQLRLGKHVQ